MSSIRKLMLLPSIVSDCCGAPRELIPAPLYSGNPSYSNSPGPRGSLGFRCSACGQVCRGRMQYTKAATVRGQK